MEYLVYIIIALYIWEVYLETHWYTCSLYHKYINVKSIVIDFIKAKLKL